MASFDTIVRQMTEMFQLPKCLSKNDRNISAKKKQLKASLQDKMKEHFASLSS